VLAYVARMSAAEAALYRPVPVRLP
jgi:hypothetical protein